ncbi:MAG TPA: hypothetical protein VGL90_09440 [Casimicrobiaceae bacterium]
MRAPSVDNRRILGASTFEEVAMANRDKQRKEPKKPKQPKKPKI